MKECCKNCTALFNGDECAHWQIGLDEEGLEHLRCNEFTAKKQKEYEITLKLIPSIYCPEDEMHLMASLKTINKICSRKIDIKEIIKKMYIELIKEDKK